MEYPSVVCKNDVGNEDKAFQCELCEDVGCIRECERPDSTLYDGLVRSRTKCLSFICTRFRKKGSLIKQFMKFEYELARAQDERLASARLLDQAEARAQASEQRIAELQQEHHELQAEVKKLSEQLKQQLDSPGNKPPELPRTKRESEEELPPQSEHDSSSSESTSSATSSTASTRTQRQIQRLTATRLHPPGFKEVSCRVDKFSGKQAEVEVWLDNYVDATTDCG